MANNSVLAGLVLLFLAAHFLLLAGILIRIVLTSGVDVACRIAILALIQRSA